VETRLELGRARELARAALASLEASRQRIDDLNVYPVPDGDTGTNLTLTLRAAVDAVERSDARDAQALAREVTRATLLGARGNSGVILSQIVRGFAEAAANGGLDRGAALARAFRAASDAAYRAVREPAEGTILTVARELAEEAESPELAGAAPVEVLRRVVSRGERALARTPELLDVLRAAGVVDAGGAGLLEIVRGLAAGVAGEPLPERPAERERLGSEAIHQELSRYRYCTMFVVEGPRLDLRRLERDLERLGDSLLVVGDASAAKVHVHTDDPGAALAVGTRAGVVDAVEIANMHRQTEKREERLTALASEPVAHVAVVAVAPGAGNRRLLEAYGASRVVEGGQTANPSTRELLDSVEAVPAQEVILLPNNPNVLLAAEQAASLASKPVRVLPTRSLQAGLAAMAAYVATASADRNEAAMRAAAEQAGAGEVTRASRDAELDGVRVRRGAWLGLVDDRAVAAGDDFDAVAGDVVECLLAPGRDVLTLVTGAEEPELASLLEAVRARHPGLEVEVVPGGQPHYPLLLLAE